MTPVRSASASLAPRRKASESVAGMRVSSVLNYHARTAMRWCEGRGSYRCPPALTFPGDRRDLGRQPFDSVALQASHTNHRSKNGMANERPDAAAQVQQLLGALEIFDLLREEMAQWLEEAQDESKQECLENVVGHIGAIEVSYRQRLTETRAEAGQ